MDAGREEEIRGESLRRGGEHTGNSGGGGRTAARSSSRRTSLSLFRLVLQARSRLMIVDDVLPRAPLPSDPSFHDGHSSLFSSLSFSLSLSPHSLRSRSLARSLARSRSRTLSRSSLTGTLGQHPRYTATRSGVAALASSPAVPPRKRTSFLLFLLPCLPAASPPAHLLASLVLTLSP